MEQPHARSWWGAALSRWPEVLVALALLWWALGALDAYSLAWPFTTDDAYITLRYAKHWSLGRGILWNVGDPPVEGYSNFLHLVLGRVALGFGADAPLVLKVVGVVAALAGGVGIYFFASPLLGRVAALAPAMFFLSDKGVIWWAASGLETTTYAALATFGMLAFVRGVELAPDNEARSLRMLRLSGVVLFLTALTRFEGAMYAGIAAGLLWAHEFVVGRRLIPAREFWRRLFALLLPFVVLYAAYTAWRLSYYGRPLPNSFYCKSQYLKDPAQLVRVFARDLGPWIPAALLGAVVMRRLRVFALVIPLCLYGVLLWNRDPLIGQQHRHFVAVLSGCYIPALAFLAALAGGAIASRRAQLAIVMASALLAGRDVRSLAPTLVSDADRFSRREDAREAMAAFADKILRPGETWVTGDAGVGPYSSERRVLDAYCLNDRESTADGKRDSGKTTAKRILKEKPELLFLASRSFAKFRPRASVWKAVAKNKAFEAEYSHVRNFGGGTFCYWAYVRNDIAEREQLERKGAAPPPVAQPEAEPPPLDDSDAEQTADVDPGDD